MDGLRVAHIMESFYGGTARHLADFVAHTPDVDHHVYAPIHKPDEAFARAKAEVGAVGATLHERKMFRPPVHPGNAWAVAALRRDLARLNPDVVHAHSSIAGAVGRVAAAGLGKPVVYTPHGLAQGRATLAIESRLTSLCDRWIAVSESEAADAVARRIVAPPRLVVVANGVDPTVPPAHDVDLRAELGLPRDATLVASVGRITWQKAPEVLVRAAQVFLAQVPDAYFLLIGTGPDEDLLERELAGAGLGDKFRHLKVLPRAAAAFPQFDVFVLASRFEGAPYVALEAMRASLPMVLTDVVGNRDAIVDGESGVLVPPDDPEALGNAVAGLLRDASKRAAFGRAARARLVEHFTIDAMTKSLLALYADAIAAKTQVRR